MLKTVEKFTVDNSPHILTAIGASGVLVTAVLAAKAAYQVGLDEYMEYDISGTERSTRELFETHWRPFIPAAVAGTLSVTAIIGANRVGTRRAAALAVAYSLSERAAVEYRDKVVEKFGEGKEREVRDEIAQERTNANPPDNQIIVLEGMQLCYDVYSDRYFENKMEGLKKAQNDFYYELLNNSYASLTDYYQRVGLSSTPYSDDVGWNANEGKFDIGYTSTIATDGRPAIAITFLNRPNKAYYKFH